MAGELAGRKVAVLATDGVEEVELVEPMKALREAGAEVHLVSLEAGSIQGLNHLDKGSTFPVDVVVADANPADYVGLVLPGGVANPDNLRTNAAAVQFARAFVEADKPVAAICHGPWLLVEGDLVKGRTLTSWPSLQTDIRNAGGEWVDQAVTVDQKLITSRKPADLPAFCDRLLASFAAERSENSLDAMVEQTFPASDPLPGPSTIGKTAERRDRPRDEPRV
jgi:protease I